MIMIHYWFHRFQDGAGHSGSITYIVQVKAENKEKPTITPKQLTAEIDEKYSGIIDFDNVSITVTDSDSVSIMTYNFEYWSWCLFRIVFT